jgi:hypothetical protein
MKSFLRFLTVGVMAGALSNGVAAEKATVKPVAITSSHFEATGKVAMHPGRPCTSQIMFDFRPAHTRDPVWLAAHVKESKILTEAARHRRTVQVSGVWQHGQEGTCRYVNITRVTVQKNFFSW